MDRKQAVQGHFRIRVGLETEDPGEVVLRITFRDNQLEQDVFQFYMPQVETALAEKAAQRECGRKVPYAGQGVGPFGAGLPVHYCDIVQDDGVERKDAQGTNAYVAVNLFLKFAGGEAGKTCLHGRYLQRKRTAEQQYYEQADEPCRYVSFLADSQLHV